MLCRWLLVALALLTLLGCGSSPRVLGIKPYRIEIQQGNALTQDMVQQLRPGMTKDQVRFVLGTPLVTDIFHGNRWDYPYYRERAGSKREESRIVVYFEEGKLVRVEGQAMPAVRQAERSGT